MLTAITFLAIPLGLGLVLLRILYISLDLVLASEDLLINGHREIN